MNQMICDVSPAMAEEWLRKNISNRKVRPSWVLELSRRITAGEWKLTHQGIAFDRNNVLIDGQHRLHAIVKSGVTVPMQVTFGFDVVNRAVDFPVDCGALRRANDAYGVSPAFSQTISFIAKIAAGGIRSFASLQPYMTAFSPACSAMLEVCSSTAKSRSCAAIKAAVCINGSRRDVDKMAIFNQYRSFVLVEYEFMKPSVASLNKSISLGHNLGKEANPLFVRAFRAFSPEYWERSKIVIRDSEIVVAEARELIAKIMAGSLP
jgi:hypothetical protein